MRLTKKIFDTYYGDVYECHQKLGQLEDILEGHNIETLEELDGLLWYVKRIKDIEEELGIDLITLFKALKDGVYYRLGNSALILNKEGVEKIGFSIDVNENYTEKIKLEDYGKTWALTKEELL